MDYVYDIETYPNCFTLCIASVDGKDCWVFEISDRKDDSKSLRGFLTKLFKRKDRMIGYNNLFFDYPVVHHFLSNKGLTAGDLYDRAMKIINADEDERFAYFIPERKQFIAQIDLYKIHHFDNKARSTSLKMLEFNMKSDNIEDLPFPVGTNLTDDQIDTLIKYNIHDVKQTHLFWKESVGLIEFREDLSEKYGKSFINFNDTKIGKEYFVMKLEEEMPGCCYRKGEGGRKLNQTHRKTISLDDVIFPYVTFNRPEFKAVEAWLRSQVITETKGVFTEILESDLGDLAKFCKMRTKRKKLAKEPSEKSVEDFKKKYPLGWIDTKVLKSGDVSYYQCWNIADNLNTVLGDFQFDFGTGGAHGSVESQIVSEDDEFMILDVDVASMYPNIAIANRVYPEHLSDKFCDIYKDVYEQRKSFAKGTPENAMMKLALNGVYGASNDKFSPFYDPKFTMAITVNGQLSLAMLTESFLTVDRLSVIQVNTDGVTVKFPRVEYENVQKLYHEWEETTGLELEEAIYSRMMIRDVNNYIAEYTGGKLKRKGTYEYEGLGWHQNHSSKIVAKAAEYALVHGGSVEQFIMNHKDKYDFMLRTKVPRSSKLKAVDSEGNEVDQQNICRYYVSTDGVSLIKVMPPIEGKTKTKTIYKDELTGVEYEAINKTENDKYIRKGFVVVNQIILPPTERRIGIESSKIVTICNDIKDFTWNIDYDHYIEQAKKIVDPLLTHE